ncbi:MAG: hypothetical protein AB7N99_00340 [Simkaniaceae bacterium]
MAACTSVREAIVILSHYQESHESEPESLVKDAAKFVSKFLKNSDLSQIRSDTEITEKIQHREITRFGGSCATSVSKTELCQLQCLLQGNPYFKEKDRQNLQALVANTYVSSEARAYNLIEKLVAEPDTEKREQVLKQYLMYNAFVGSKGITSTMAKEKATLFQQVQLQLDISEDPEEREALEHLQKCLDPTNTSFPNASEIRSGAIAESARQPVSRTVEECRKSQKRRISLYDSPMAYCPEGNPHVQLNSMHRERLWRLNHLEEVYVATIQDTNQQVRTKTMGPTKGWYVGSCRKTGQAPFEQEMEKFGHEHGIFVVSDSREQLEHSLVFDDDLDAAYPQDFIEFTEHEIRIPYAPLSFLQDKTKQVMDAGILEDRKTRFARYNDPNVRISTIGSATVGQVLSEGQQEKAVRLALALNVPVTMSLTYSEGGNTLSGQKSDGTPYIIIGHDSFAATRAILERDLGRSVSDIEVKMAFGVDYGIPIDEIYFIEQPGDFHLDMNMAIVGDKVVAVNDAVQAYELFEPEYERYLREEMGIEDGQQIAQFKRQTLAGANLKREFEDQAAKDLESQGFEVRRVPGSFEYKRGFGPHATAMNFFNMVSGVAPNGNRVIVAMGCINADYEDRFRHMVRDLNPTNIHFLNPEMTRTSLAKHGGISCRSKTI